MKDKNEKEIEIGQYVVFGSSLSKIYLVDGDKIKLLISDFVLNEEYYQVFIDINNCECEILTEEEAIFFLLKTQNQR
jgi:hypothetical protein